MTERLRQRWEELIDQAGAWKAGDDPTPALEAFGYAVVYAMVDAVDALPAKDRQLLLGLRAGIERQVRELALSDRDERESWLDAVTLVGAAAEVLGGGEAPLDALAADAIRPTPSRLQATLNGELDGISAASVAGWYLHRDASEPRVLWSLAGGARSAAALIPLAADEKKSVRPPQGGRVVAELPELRVEARYFEEERELAVYCSDPAALRLYGPELSFVDMQPGYWLGRVAEGVSGELEVELHVGDSSTPLCITI